MALSADGNTAIVGGPGDNDYAGAAWVYTRSGGVWSQQGGKLIGAGAVGSMVLQGTSVALSADGNTAIVGGYGDNGYAGATWVYTRSGGVWSQQGGKLIATGAVGSMVFHGGSVALSADGNTAIVGGLGDNQDIGAVWVYTRSGGVWSQQGGKLVGTGVVGLAFLNPFSQQGASVALSADGSTAVVGGPADNGFAGAAWVYTRSGGVWSQQGGKLVGTGVVDLEAAHVGVAPGEADQGTSVALSADGNTAIVGGPSDDNSHAGSGHVGAAWVYTRSGGVWSQKGCKLVGAGAVGDASQGWGVALSADGNTAIVGGPRDNGAAGATWVFVNSVSPTGTSIASGCAVVNGASFVPGIAPGTWTTIQGSNLSATTRIWDSSDFSGSNLPTQLDGVSVTVNGKPAYVYFISPAQLNVLTPDDTTRGSVPVQVTTAQGKSNVVTVSETALAPALFTFSPQGGKYVAAVRADGAYLGPPNLVSGLATVPAKPGDVILLFGTGFGPTTPSNPIGQLVSPAPLADQVTVRIAGLDADTQFAGIVSPGLYQFNVVVPNVPNGDKLVWVGVGGSFSQLNKFLNVQR